VITPTLTKKLKQHPVIKAAYQISQRVETPVYLVGGAVRDLLMGILPEKDFDFVTENHLEKAARLFSRIVSGSLIRWSSDPPNYRVIFYWKNNRTEVDFSGFRGDDLYQDLAERDFTVNAIALMVNELFNGADLKLYDPLEGKEDLQKRILRTTSSHSFDKDPLRILRAIRIAIARNLTIDFKTREEIRCQKERLRLVAAERIRSEFFKIISFPGAKDSLKLLEELGLLSLLIPETEYLKVRDMGESQSLSLWEHSLETVSWCEWVLDYRGEIFSGFQENLKSHFYEEIEADVDRYCLLKLGGLLHDVEESSREKGGRNVVGKVVRRFKLGKRANRILRKLVEYYRRPLHLLQLERVNTQAYFRFFRDLGPEGLDVLVLSWADFISQQPERFETPLDLKFRNLINSLMNYYLREYLITSPQPLISGKDIIEKFGLKEGEIIGNLLNQIASAEAEGCLSSRKEAFLYLGNLIKKMG